MAEGIEVRHRKGCRSLSGGRCGCEPSYRASVWSRLEDKLIRKSFPTEAAAKGWRADAQTGVRKGTLRAPAPTTIEEAGAAWLDGARAGLIRTRSGQLYKPAAIRGYEKALRREVVPAIGGMRVTDVRRIDLQDLVDGLMARGLSASTVSTVVTPLRAIYRRAENRGEVGVNPTRGLELPAITGGRERIAEPSEAHKLIQALLPTDRPIWATAMYAGLRRGELKALRWPDVDLGAGVIRVERGWDDIEGEQETKGRNKRRVPIAAVLRDYLDEHRLQTQGDGLVFGRDGKPFIPRRLSDRADDAWKAAKLNRITLHECRHTFASLMIAAGVNAKALSTYMGHANIGITLDRYGHLMPGNEEEAAGLLDSYLEAWNARARACPPSGSPSPVRT